MSAEENGQPENMAKEIIQGDEYLKEFPDDEDYKARLKELEVQMKEVEEREKEITERIRVECKAEMDERMKRLEKEVTTNLDSRMHNLEDRYRSHTSDIVTSKQTEVLRANKVLREVARGLGPDWRFVFRYLMAGHPKDVIDIEMEKLERVKPFMQSYKALLTWKEYKGEEFDIRQLIKALQDNLKTDLAFMASEIMESEGETLLTLHNVGKGIASGAEEQEAAQGGGADSAGADGASGDVGPGAEGTTATTSPERKRLSMNDGEAVEGPIGDTKLLQVARKLGRDWPGVAKRLELPEEEVAELQEITDETMAAFRMLWSWRDANAHTKRESDLAADLVTVLRRSGRTDLAQIFNRESAA